jgi:hypothetical protein
VVSVAGALSVGGVAEGLGDLVLAGKPGGSVAGECDGAGASAEAVSVGGAGEGLGDLVRGENVGGATVTPRLGDKLPMAFLILPP